MPTLDRVEAFLTRVEARDFLGAMEDFYHDDATAQENSHPPRIGLPALLANERATLQRFPDTRIREVKRFAINGDVVFINWEFEMASGDTIRLLDEVVLQTWRGDRITSERFYYDPGQMK
jgi:ketosteroid isomerase-like protein